MPRMSNYSMTVSISTQMLKGKITQTNLFRAETLSGEKANTTQLYTTYTPDDFHYSEGKTKMLIIIIKNKDFLFLDVMVFRKCWNTLISRIFENIYEFKMRVNWYKIVLYILLLEHWKLSHIKTLNVLGEVFRYSLWNTLGIIWLGVCGWPKTSCHHL